MESRQVVYVGVDVSKETLSVDADRLFKGDLPNTEKGFRKLIGALRKAAPCGILHVVFESTGPYGSRLFSALCREGVLASQLNPAKVRHFARAMSQTAKTDRIDARVIRLFAEAKRPEPDRAPSEGECGIRQLVLARNALMKSLVQLTGTLESLTDTEAAAYVKKLARTARDEIRRIEKAIAATAKKEARLAGLVGELAKIEGVGGLTAATVVSLVPELGTLGRRNAAALAGLAPFTRASGKWKGRAFVSGGRDSLRRALFMPATVASRCNPVLKSVYERLRKAGKPYKVAITAVMRKLFAHMDCVAAKWIAEHGAPEVVPVPKPLPA